MKCICGNDKFHYIEKTFSNGSKHFERWCVECGAFNKYAPRYEVKPEEATPENVADFIIPFGKYKGKSLCEIYGADMSYLYWASKNLKEDNIREKIEIFLTPARIILESSKDPSEVELG